MNEAERQRVGDWLGDAVGAESVTIEHCEKLSGGAIQQNWAINIDVRGGADAGRQAWVLRTDSPSAVSVSRSRVEEFALLRAAHGAGVTVPEPLCCCADATVLGRPFFVMRRVGGIAQGHKVVRHEALAGGRTQLVEGLGRELGRIHAIRPPRADLAFLTVPEGQSPAHIMLRKLRSAVDRDRTPRPVMEWGLRELERRLPPTDELVLCHNDFRTGNFMADGEGITGVLDWEFAAWGDPHEDIGWLCAPCWRFGNRAMEVGGIGERASFYAAYEIETGRKIDPIRVRFWEVMGTLRWMAIAIAQAERHLSGTEASLELALTGHIVPELEVEVLRMLEEDGDA